jgi:hypothetical protein
MKALNSFGGFVAVNLVILVAMGVMTWDTLSPSRKAERLKEKIEANKNINCEGWRGKPLFYDDKTIIISVDGKLHRSKREDCQ